MDPTEHLPHEVFVLVLDFLPDLDLLTAACVSQAWHAAASDPYVFQLRFKRRFPFAAVPVVERVVREEPGEEHDWKSEYVTAVKNERLFFERQLGVAFEIDDFITSDPTALPPARQPRHRRAAAHRRKRFGDSAPVFGGFVSRPPQAASLAINPRFAHGAVIDIHSAVSTGTVSRPPPRPSTWAGDTSGEDASPGADAGDGCSSSGAGGSGGDGSDAAGGSPPKRIFALRSKVDPEVFRLGRLRKQLADVSYGLTPEQVARVLGRNGIASPPLPEQLPDAIAAITRVLPTLSHNDDALPAAPPVSAAPPAFSFGTRTPHPPPADKA